MTALRCVPISALLALLGASSCAAGVDFDAEDQANIGKVSSQLESA